VPPPNGATIGTTVGTSGGVGRFVAGGATADRSRVAAVTFAAYRASEVGEPVGADR
jgi:hypothetical protein